MGRMSQREFAQLMAQILAAQNHALAVAPFSHKPKFCDTPSLRKHPPTVTPHEQIDEKSNFINDDSHRRDRG